MTIFRPSNINKRLVGTKTTATGGSPGNAGQIGPTKAPYCVKGLCREICLGQRCCGAGSNGGIFKINESFCGKKENCDVPFTDFRGFFICCGPSTTKWIVAPSCAQVTTDWYNISTAVSTANSCMGSCGWFVPSLSELGNPGYGCRIYWDYSSDKYWSSTQGSPATRGCTVNFTNGQQGQTSKPVALPVRAFRTVS